MSLSVTIQKPPPVEVENGLLYVRVLATGDRYTLMAYAKAYPATQAPPALFDQNDELRPAAGEWEGLITFPNGPFKVRLRADFEADDPTAPPIQVFEISAVYNPP